MNGEQLYEMYAAANNWWDTEVAPWAELTNESKEIWEELAAQIVLKFKAKEAK